MHRRMRADNSENRMGFTLMEMLVVIAIIGILLGLLLPALAAARHHSRVTRTKREVKELQEAWLNYQSEFKMLPQVVSMDSNAVAMLRGENPKGIQFLDFRATTTNYCDPWGGVYRVETDQSNMNKVAVKGAVGTLSVPASVAVWSLGRDGWDFSEDDIKSWE